ncbi:MAG: cation:proton antiporter [Alphaproteobacteria bacterium]|jgi:CPA2 family monovalent cation:H+ antiporter-2|nr:cation:proton antiporter [Alphaproteobacteria bacterium]
MEYDIQLTEITLVIVAALAGGLGLARLKQPPILGYILAGILLGPSGMGLIQSREQVGLLAELGVLLLLFVVGMDLSLRTFKKVWVVSTLCTVLQVSASILITMVLSKIFGWSFGLSLLLGFVLSLSSTAVVVKMLESIGEMRTETGQMAIGVLIAQDLAIVPMILILRNLDKPWHDPSLIFKIVLSIGLIAGLIVYLSRKQRVRIPLTKIISGDKDLTPLASLTFCFAAAAVSGLIGLSAAYGAFLAGLVLGNTHERLIMLETTKPIQSILMMAFFLSIGLLLDTSFIWEHLGTVFLFLLILTIGKTAINITILHLLRLPWSQAFLIGVVLAQLGEFAFLLSTVGHETHIITDFGEKLIIALTVLSLALSPLWLTVARRLHNFADSTTISLPAILHQLFSREVGILRRVLHKPAIEPAIEVESDTKKPLKKKTTHPKP